MNTAYLELLPHLICLQVTFLKLPTSVVPGGEKCCLIKVVSPPAFSKVRDINTSGFLSSKQSLAYSPN